MKFAGGLLCFAMATVPYVLFGQSLAQHRARSEEYPDFNYGVPRSSADWVEAISVDEPRPRSDVHGAVTVRFHAPGMRFAKASCWQQPDASHPSRWGHDVELTDKPLALDADGNGSFVFPADAFPHGPTTIRILARESSTRARRDVYELQLFNTGGVHWQEGVPDAIPPGAHDLKLIFQDDFNGPLSISRDGRLARYSAHKPRFGDFSGWPFTDPLGPSMPFEQVGTWLRIRAERDARSPGGRTGLLSSVNMDGDGVWARAPVYFEARFVAQSAPGTWPGFWTLTHLDRNVPADEHDIIEAYGGFGPGNPNHPGYSIASHFWRQQAPSGSPKKGFSAKPNIRELGGRSSWSTTFHTYGLRIGLEQTVYYFDDIEVLRHPTNELSKTSPHFFLLNYAIGGLSGWKIDLARYGDASDMYIDYVRVFAREPISYTQPRPESSGKRSAR